MKGGESDIASVDDYIAAQPERVRDLLTRLRATIRRAAPNATEKLSYRVPTFFLYGNLVHFAAFRNHIGFYPTPSAIEAFARELRPYRHAKGSIQFPLDEPLPLDLVERMVEFRVRDNSRKQGARRKS